MKAIIGGVADRRGLRLREEARRGAWIGSHGGLLSQSIFTQAKM